MSVNDCHVSFYYENDMDIGAIEIDRKKSGMELKTFTPEDIAESCEKRPRSLCCGVFAYTEEL